MIWSSWLWLTVPYVPLSPRWQVIPSLSQKTDGSVNKFNCKEEYHSDVIISTTASQITGISIVCSTVCLGVVQRKHQSSASLVFVRGIHRWPVSKQNFCEIRHELHDDVIKWKHFPRFWPFVRWPVNSPHKGQWRGAFMFSLICAWINRWVNNREAGDMRRYRTHYDVIVMVNRFRNGLQI